MSLGIIVVGLLLFVLPPVAIALYVLWMVRDEYREPRVPILNYHRFLEAARVRSGEIVDAERVWAVEDDDLDDQCRALREAGYETVDLDQLHAFLTGRGPLPKRPIIFTFDDGYLSNWTLAAPILERHGMRGVFYVALDPDAHTREGVLGKDDWMTPEQWKALRERGHMIGSHSMTHGLLSEMSEEQVRWELTESKQRLEALLGEPVPHFCIPRAGGNRQIVRWIGEAGYVTSTGADKGTAGPGRHPLRLPRIGVPRGQRGAALLARLRPLRAAKERILADIRLVPTRLLGPRAGYNIRKVLYGGPIRRALLQDRLGTVIGALGLCYMGLGVAWLLSVLG
ncbi:MAG: poly-beta,6-N-acetyl-D-glucosamine N-deacetylase precursor [Pseudomonadota bacterium]